MQEFAKKLAALITDTIDWVRRIFEALSRKLQGTKPKKLSRKEKKRQQRITERAARTYSPAHPNCRCQIAPIDEGKHKLHIDDTEDLVYIPGRQSGKPMQNLDELEGLAKRVKPAVIRDDATVKVLTGPEIDAWNAGIVEPGFGRTFHKFAVERDDGTMQEIEPGVREIKLEAEAEPPLLGGRIPRVTAAAVGSVFIDREALAASTHRLRADIDIHKAEIKRLQAVLSVTRHTIRRKKLEKQIEFHQNTVSSLLKK